MQNSNGGSSETIRKAPYFNFYDFYTYGHAKHVPRISETFLEWFIGFFEGDGYLGFSKKRFYTRLRNGKVYKEQVCERLYFHICQKERKIIEKLAYSFGFGGVSSFTKKGEVYWRWTLDSKNAIESIAYLLSGNLIMKERQNQFLQWVEAGEKKNMFQLPFNKKKPYCSTIHLNNAWLSGFIDAEACFYAHFYLPFSIQQEMNQLPTMKKNWSKEHYKTFLEISKSKFRLSQKMTLTQISTVETNELFKQILFLFNGKSFYIFKNDKVKKLSNKNYVRVEFGSLSSQKIIIDYLSNYPLKTIKHISFRKWSRIYLRRKEGVHLSPKGTKRLYRLVNTINQHSKKHYEKKIN